MAADPITLLIIAWIIRALGGGKSPGFSPVPPRFPGPVPIPVPGPAVPGVPGPGPSPGPSVYTIQSGDTGVKLAKRATGDANRWKEILKANPDLTAVTAPNPDTGVMTTQIVPWQIGQVIKVPPGWKL